MVDIAMKQFNVRVSNEIYDAVRQKAKAQDTSLSEFVRDIVTKACTVNGKSDPQQHEIITWLREELQQRNEEIRLLRTSQSEERQRHDTIVLQMARQAENTQHQLEDLRKPKGKWWELGGK